MTMTQLLLDGFTPVKPKQRQAPVILARRKSTCGFRCGQPIRIGDPITVLANGKWVHTHDVNDAEIAKRAALLITPSSEKPSEEEVVRAIEATSMYPEEALEETAEWQRAHLPPEQRWHR